MEDVIFFFSFYFLSSSIRIFCRLISYLIQQHQNMSIFPPNELSIVGFLLSFFLLIMNNGNKPALYRFTYFKSFFFFQIPTPPPHKNPLPLFPRGTRNPDAPCPGGEAAHTLTCSGSTPMLQKPRPNFFSLGSHNYAIFHATKPPPNPPPHPVTYISHSIVLCLLEPEKPLLHRVRFSGLGLRGGCCEML